MPGSNRHRLHSMDLRIGWPRHLDMGRLHLWRPSLKCNILLLPGCTGVPSRATGKHRYIARILPIAQPRATQLTHLKICLYEVPTKGDVPKLSWIISHQYHHSFNIMCATTGFTLPFSIFHVAALCHLTFILITHISFGLGLG
jgi:hypothetical protein